jgi:DNA-binding PadR family transcriptional regulator
MKLKPDEFVILAVLCEGEQHSSEIMQGVYRLTNGGLIVRSSELYSILHGLTNKALIEPIKRSHEQSGLAGGRTYYRITPLGCEIVQGEAEEKARGKWQVGE